MENKDQPADQLRNRRYPAVVYDERGNFLTLVDDPSLSRVIKVGKKNYKADLVRVDAQGRGKVFAREIGDEEAEALDRFAGPRSLGQFCPTCGQSISRGCRVNGGGLLSVFSGLIASYPER